jgi:hypothetical protein
MIMDQNIASENVFRVTPDGRYIHNNEQISQEEFNARKAEADATVKKIRGAGRSKMSPRDRSKSAFDELDFDSLERKKGGAVKKYAKGGKVNLGNCGVSTHQKSKKSPSW